MEFFKMAMNLAFLAAQTTGWSLKALAELLHREVWCRKADTIQLVVPSLLYIVQDNLIIFALSCLDAATYQVTYQLRILTTAMFAKMLLNKQLTKHQWLALVLLMAGVVLAQVSLDYSFSHFLEL